MRMITATASVATVAAAGMNSSVATGHFVPVSGNYIVILSEPSVDTHMFHQRQSIKDLTDCLLNSDLTYYEMLVSNVIGYTLIH